MHEKISNCRGYHHGARRGWLGSGFIGPLVSILVLLAAYAAPAATPTPRAAPGPTKKPPSSTFDRQWAELIAAAKREGKLVLIAGVGWTDPKDWGQVAEAFKKKFGITITVGRGTQSVQVDRMMAERRGGVYNVDLVSAGITIRERVLPAGALDPIKPLLFHPEVVDKSLWKGGVHRYGDAAQKYIFLFGGQTSAPSIAINTKHVRVAEIKSYRDLLDPKWHGKIIAFHPRVALDTATFSELYYSKDAGPEFLRRIYSKGRLAYVTTTREFADFLAGGGYHIGFLEAGARRDIRDLQKLGAPVSMLEGPDAVMKSEGVGPRGGGLIVAVNNPPNPNAQKLFLNWFLSREGQLLYTQARPSPAGADMDTLRRDVPSDGVRPAYRVSEHFYMFEADPDGAAKEEIAKNFIRALINELGL